MLGAGDVDIDHRRRQKGEISHKPVEHSRLRRVEPFATENLTQRLDMNSPTSVAILIFDDVEVLDFCGPFEVFSVANRDAEDPVFDVFTVAESQTILARGGLSVNRHFALDDCPTIDVLLVPGGVGVHRLLERSSVVSWVTKQAASCSLVTSVCTGAVLLGKCGLLDGLEVTTHHQCLQQVRDVAPNAIVRAERRYIDTGQIVTSAGISAGIDMSLHLVSRLIGLDEARGVADRMEYRWEQDG